MPFIIQNKEQTTTSSHSPEKHKTSRVILLLDTTQVFSGYSVANLPLTASSWSLHWFMMLLYAIGTDGYSKRQAVRCGGLHRYRHDYDRKQHEIHDMKYIYKDFVSVDKITPAGFFFSCCKQNGHLRTKMPQLGEVCTPSNTLKPKLGCHLPFF